VTDLPTLAAGSPTPPCEIYDVALLDLDGVVYVGPDAVPGCPEALAAARQAGMRLGYVTNNASRTPEDVAAHLEDLGIPAEPDQVITSAQAAASVVAARFGVRARVLPVGGPGVSVALHDAGLIVVEEAEDHPVAVVQGYGRGVGWGDLAEAVVAVRGGAQHVATNTDATIPSPRGPLPGNGAMVGVVSAVTGRPPLVTGKPDPAMHAECVRRTGAQRPIVVGDRLDTDIEGARRAEATSLLVFTGVTNAATLLAAPPQQRPDLISSDLSGLLVAHPEVHRDGHAWVCGGWRVQGQGQDLTLSARDSDPGGTDDGCDALRALCVAHWTAHADSAAPGRPRAAGPAAERELARWGLAAR
jgi:glycerol 3-phosphatase-2